MKKKRFFIIPVILLLVVAVAGWYATDYLGNKARQEIIREGQASALTLSIYVSSTLNKFEEAVKSLAGSPWIVPALLSKRARDIEHANSALDRYNSALHASVSYLMDADGMTVASSNRNDPDSFVGKSYRFRPYFQAAAKGQPDRYFAPGTTSGKRGFYASHPVQNLTGEVVGVITMKKDLEEMQTFFSQYSFCFLISPEGIFLLYSAPSMVLKSLQPPDKAAQEKIIVSKQFVNKPFEAVMKKEIADGTEVTLEGNDYFVSRTKIDSNGWSIVLLTPTDRIRAYKMIGILATILVGLVILIFYGVIYVTEKTKETIRRSEEPYKVLAEKSIAGVYVVQDGKFRFINSNAAAYAGYTWEELLGCDVSMLVSPEDREKVRQNARAMLLGKESFPYEFRIITKQGETRWIMETVTSILYEGRQAILGSSMNITEQKKSEDELRKAYKSLQDAKNQLVQSEKLASIGTLAYGAAQEILNPLNVLSLKLQMMEVMKHSEGDLESSIETCKSQIKRIARIVDDMRTFSRLPKKKFEEIDRSEIIDHVMGLIAPRIKTEDVAAEVHCDPDVPLLSMDREAIEQVLFNLVSNALDAMNGREKRILRVSTEKKGDSVLIGISDTGHGIKAEDFPKLFDPFFTTKGPDKGTGLGLTVTYGIIQTHNGRIWAENNEWGGASFFIELPIEKRN